MARDNTGVEETCPYINSAISALEFMRDKLIEIENTDDDWKWVCKDAVDQLEKARSAHYKLREFGNEHIAKEEEFEEDLEKANREIKDLYAEIKSLEKTVRELEEQIANS